MPRSKRVCGEAIVTDLPNLARLVGRSTYRP